MKTILTYTALLLLGFVLVTVQSLVLVGVASNVVHMVSKSLNGN
jgi:NADH:ubiquinone oxidoreductase subunit 4 (subunit M)